MEQTFVVKGLRLPAVAAEEQAEGKRGRAVVASTETRLMDGGVLAAEVVLTAEEWEAVTEVCRRATARLVGLATAPVRLMVDDQTVTLPGPLASGR